MKHLLLNWLNCTLLPFQLLLPLFLKHTCSQRAEAVLFQGQWSEEGCHVNKALSTPTMTVCECSHLTNFAILLSARPPTFTPAQSLALQAFGYIGVSVSLVAMAATIFVFLYLK